MKLMCCVEETFKISIIPQAILEIKQKNTAGNYPRAMSSLDNWLSASDCEIVCFYMFLSFVFYDQAVFDVRTTLLYTRGLCSWHSQPHLLKELQATQ